MRPSKEVLLARTIKELDELDDVNVDKYLAVYQKADELLFQCCSEFNWELQHLGHKHDEKFRQLATFSEKLNNVPSSYQQAVQRLKAKRGLADKKELERAHSTLNYPPDTKLFLSSLKRFAPKSTSHLIKPTDYNTLLRTFGAHPLSSYSALLAQHSWPHVRHHLRCSVFLQNSTGHSLTCLTGYQLQPNVLWRQTNRVCDLLTIAHQFGHVMHYNVSMDSQPFYRFMPINIVKETFGFFWEALGLAYLCAISDEQTQDMLQRSYSLRSYHQWEEALRLKKEQKAKPALFYPLARQLGEKLALQVLQQTLSKNDVMSLMQRGKNLSTEELIVVTNSVKYLKTTPYYV